MSKELEFISVDDTDHEDEYAMNESGYNSSDNTPYDRVIGNSCLNQSKVRTNSSSMSVFDDSLCL